MGRVWQPKAAKAASWSFVVDLPRTEDGKRRQVKRHGFRTRREAEVAMATVLTSGELEATTTGSQRTPTKRSAPGNQREVPTVSDWLEEWLTSVHDSLRLSTYTLYEMTARKWIKPRIGDLRIDQVDPKVAEALYRDLQVEGLSPRSARLAHQVLKLSLDKAVAWGMVTSSGLDRKVELPKLNTHRVEPWAPEEARAFLDLTRGTRLWPLWMLLLTTGLRRGEALGLGWSHLDLDQGRLVIARSLVASANGPRIELPKTASGRRVVPLVPDAVAAFTLQRELQEQDRKALGSWPDHDFVFTTQVGTPYDPRNISRYFKEACAATGIRRIRLHDTRHTVATMALVSGTHPKLVQELLGHANIQITLDTYSHVLAGVSRQAADNVAGVLFGDRTLEDPSRPGASACGHVPTGPPQVRDEALPGDEVALPDTDVRELTPPDLLVEQ